MSSWTVDGGIVCISNLAPPFLLLDGALFVIIAPTLPRLFQSRNSSVIRISRCPRAAVRRARTGISSDEATYA